MLFRGNSVVFPMVDDDGCRRFRQKFIRRYNTSSKCPHVPCDDSPKRIRSTKIQ